MTGVAANRAHLPPSIWTEGRDTKLKKLWGDGLTASQIACELGGLGHCADGGRSAVCGRIHRLGLSGRVRPKRNDGGTTVRRINGRNGHTDRAATQRLKLKAERTKKVQYINPTGAPRIIESAVWEEPPAPAEFLGIAFLDLEGHQCKFPRGEGADIKFCGQPRLAGKPYCWSCCRVAYNYPLTAASTAKAQTADAQRRAFGT